MSDIEINTELFNISEELLYYLDSYPLNAYSMTDFENKLKIYEIINKLNKSDVIYYYNINNNKLLIISYQNLEEYLNEVNVKSKKINFDVTNDNQSKILLSLLYQSQKKYLKDKGYSYKKNTYYLENYNHISEINKPENIILNKLYDYLKIYYGFSFFYKIYNKNIHVHIIPKTIVNLEIDLYKMLSILDKKEIINNFPYINVPFNKTAKLLFFVDYDLITKLNFKPFNGKNIKVYYENTYGLELHHDDAPIFYSHVKGNNPFRFYSTEKSYPSINFNVLSKLDAEFEAEIVSLMKKKSAKRINIIEMARENFQLSTFEREFKLNKLVSGVGDRTPINDDNIKNIDSIYPFKIFSRPSVLFKNINSEIVEVNELTGNTASPGDLLSENNLKPYNVPKEISVLYVIPNQYYEDGITLLNHIKHGYSKYPAFQDLFNCNLVTKEEVISDYDSCEEILNMIHPSKYDCTVFLAPRRLTDDFLTTQLYTRLEKASLNRGVPAQFITNNPRKNLEYDASLNTKAKNPEVLFGISINILGKVGGTILKPAPRVTSNFIPNSAVLSYNVTRIYQEIDFSRSDNPFELAKNSVPYVAPTLTFSENGTEIQHQLLHQIPDETSFFKGERGQNIISNISEEYSTVIIHKDGPFFPLELNNLMKISTEKRLIPVSIITNYVPRLFSNIHEIWNTAPNGTIFELSPYDYLLASSLYTNRRIPEKFGWPNPIHIRIYDREISQNERIKLLYQIWVMTRLYLNSKYPTRRPLSVHYANKISQFLQKNKQADLPFLRKYLNYKNRHNLIPRLFL